MRRRRFGIALAATALAAAGTSATVRAATQTPQSARIIRARKITAE